MNILRISTDLFYNLIQFAFFDTFLNHFAKEINKSLLNKARIIYVFIYIIWSIIPSVPFNFILGIFLDVTYIILITKSSTIHKFFLFCLYNILWTTLINITLLIHSFITRDLSFIFENEQYYTYKQLSCNAIAYVLFCLFLNTIYKKKSFSNSKVRIIFNLMMCLSIVALSASNMIFESTVLSTENAYVLLLFLLILVIIICMFAYKKMLSIMEENTLSQIELAKNELRSDYYYEIENNLKNLSILRHDFKNHLIIIDNYNQTGQTKELDLYIKNLTLELQKTSTIQTPSVTLSSIINAKKELSDAKNVEFIFEQRFDKIFFEDFHLITIFSNILDNAITAASKLNNGYVKLSIWQIDSFLNILCENNHAEHILKRDGIFMTTKSEQKEFHGLGLTSVRRSVDTLHGSMNISYTENNFNVQIQIPNY